MFARALSAALALFLLALSASAHYPLAARSPGNTHLSRTSPSSPSSLQKRTLTGQIIAFACYGGGGDCQCPTDLNGDSGVLINVYPGFQCAYPNGACTWDDQTGVLENSAQTNCPASRTCSTTSGCSCPTDNNGDTGILINQFTGYQCAYPSGACTWDGEGSLQNLEQTNCPTESKCQQSGTDSK